MLQALHKLNYVQITDLDTMDGTWYFVLVFVIFFLYTICLNVYRVDKKNCSFHFFS